MLPLKLSTATFTKIQNIRSDLLTILLYSDKNLFNNQIIELKKIFPDKIDLLLKLEKFKGEFESIGFFYTDPKFSTPRIQLIGLGEISKVNYETFRKVAALAALNSNKYNVKNLAILYPHIPQNLDLKYVARSIFEGAILSQYNFNKYKTSKKDVKDKLKEITLYSSSKSKTKFIKAAKNISKVICESVYLARDLANMPASELFPEIFAKYAKESAKKFNYQIEIWNENKIRRMGFGGLIAVGSGSDRPPRFIILKYLGGKKNISKIVLVGKGITFDSGGISLKSSDYMSDMKMDMSGAAAVLGIMEAAVRLKIPVNLIALIPVCENMPSGSALKPGDIIKHYGGKTSEVVNTDAEGRLILADALSYAKKFNPELVIDIATLTGAVITALGHHVSAILGNDSENIQRIKNIGELTYERVWELPLYNEYQNQIKSNIADVKNLGTSGAGVITAAMFLKNFISNSKNSEYKWIHLDVAGTAILNEGSYYLKSGATGFGIRLITEFLLKYSNSFK